MAASRLVVSERAVLDEAAVDAGDEHRRGGKELLTKLSRKSGCGPADRHDQVQPLDPSSNRMRCAIERIGCLIARARGLHRDLHETNRLARRPDQLPHERLGKGGLRRERPLGGRHHQHVPGLAEGRRPTAGRGAATPPATPASNCREGKSARARILPHLPADSTLSIARDRNISGSRRPSFAEPARGPERWCHVSIATR